MKNKIINFLNENKLVIVIGILIILFVTVYMNSYNTYRTSVDNLKQELLKVSDEENIINNIKTTKETISKLDYDIKVAEENKRIQEAKSKCFKQQLDRLVEGLEYSLDYCENNIDKFMGL